jgi:hypothetical protein
MLVLAAGLMTLMVIKIAWQFVPNLLGDDDH